MAEATGPAKDYSVGTPGIRATKEYKPGDVLIDEKAFVHVVRHKNKGQYCDNCIKKM
jgi:hypothetical protein